MQSSGNFVLFTTTDWRPESIVKLHRLLGSLDASISGISSPIRLFLLLQNASPANEAELRVQLPGFVKLSSVPERISLSKARNLLLKAALSSDEVCDDDLVGFPDDDCWMPKGTLSHIEAQFRQHKTLDFWFCRYGTDAKAPACCGETKPSLQTVISKASSNTMYFRGRVTRAIGLFSEQLGVGTSINGGEDTDYALRAYHAARNTLYVDARLVGHRDFDRSLLARYYPGSLIAILRHAGLSPAGLWVTARKLMVGGFLIIRGQLSFAQLITALKVARANG